MYLCQGLDTKSTKENGRLRDRMCLVQVAYVDQRQPLRTVEIYVSSRTDSQTAQGQSSTMATQGQSSTMTTQGQSCTMTTQGQSSSMTTQSQSCTMTTQCQSSTMATQGQSSTMATQCQSSSMTTQSQSCTMTTQCQSSTMATQGQSSTMATQCQSCTMTTQGQSSSMATQGQPSPRSRKLGYKHSAALWTDILLEDVNTNEAECKKVTSVAEASEDLPSAMYDQGDHEVEVEGHGYQASARWTSCQKNVGHVDFIKPQEFTMGHLPESHRDPDIYDYIRLWCQLVVKVTVRNISMDRREGYAFHSIRGKRMPVTGSGKVADITEVEGAPCPCPECCESESPNMKWTAVWVMTAMHVVYDDSEAKVTDIELFFDQSDNKDGVRKLAGTRVVDSNVKGDWCKFECATHDLDFGRQLTEVDRQVMELGQTITERQQTDQFAPLAVIASHPHGWSKHITVGQWMERQTVRIAQDNYEWTEYMYNTSTCTGCSGAPVWIIGPDRVHYTYNYYNHVHSEGLQCGLNKSGAGDIDKHWD